MSDLGLKTELYYLGYIHHIYYVLYIELGNTHPKHYIYIHIIYNFYIYNIYIYILGHELVNTHPKHYVSWYTVGCYYYCCALTDTNSTQAGKFEFAVKYFQKSTKINKRYIYTVYLYT